MGKQYILEGGGLRQLALARQLRRAGRQVLLLVPETYLGQEICKPHRYELDEKDIAAADVSAGQLWEEWTDGAWEAPGILHPDKLKCRLEDWCRENGIDYRYQIRVLSVTPCRNGAVTVSGCGKSGRTDWKADRFISAQAFPEKKSRFAVHLWKESEPEKSLGMLYVPVQQEIPDTGSFYEKAVKAALERFEERYGQEPSVSLGRFAEDGFDPAVPVSRYISEGLSDFERMENEPSVSVYAPEKMTKQYDIIVAGGGTAGTMAALYGARNGCRVLLAEQNSILGGTATAGGVSTYWFGERFQDVIEIDRLTGEWEDRYHIPHPKLVWSKYDRFHPGIRAMVLEELNREAGAEIIKEAFVCGVKKGADGSVCGITVLTERGILEAEARCVIDATGDGDLAVMAGAAYTYGSDRDYVTYWASLAQYGTPGTYKNNFSSALVLEDAESLTDFIRLGRRRGEKTYDHGTYVAQRESRHIRGKKTVTLKDVVSYRRWEDGIYTCFSNYDPKGKLSADMVYAGVLPPQNGVQIPLGACLPVDRKGHGIGGLLVAGKAISCTRGAFPGLRMQTDLMHQGAVLGILASMTIRMGCRAEALPIPLLQKEIRESTGDSLKMPAQQENLYEAVQNLCGLRKHWIDMPFEEREERGSGSLSLMCADSKEVLPILKKRWKELLEEEKKAAAQEKVNREQMELAGYLLWHGSDLGTDRLLEGMNRVLDKMQGLPVRQGSTVCAQLLPDHGVMTEFTYRLNLLAWSHKKEILTLFERVLRRLKAQDRDYRDIRQGMYHYVEAFAYAAERTGLKEFIPLLKELLELKELKGIWRAPEKEDILTQRLLILAMLICRAGARLGDQHCMEQLKEMTRCSDRLIALSAQKEWKLIEDGAGQITEKEW